jgi:4a-hydroxytetrahydrobiopterin dehydratase
MPEKPVLLSAEQLRDELGGLDGWTGDTAEIERTVEAASFPAAIELVRNVADVAEELGHHPYFDIRWRTVRFTVSTHSAGGVTAYDVDLAKRIDRLVAEAGIRS